MKLGTELLRELVSLLESSGIAEVEIETKDFRVYLSKPKAQAPAQVIATPAAVPTAPPTTPVATVAEPAEKPGAEPAQEEVPPGLHAIRSPIIGTFYRAPAPGAEPFTDVGKRVHKGQVLCIVEAMKVMNEIESDVDGEVVKILAENAKPVEYDQVLFLIKPG
ncbi:MAG: acetyl-CoA carboxylase biotin carboxyl carrier protein [candidate division WOR-3 bacterium]